MPDLDSWEQIRVQRRTWEFCCEDGFTAFLDPNGKRVLTLRGTFDRKCAVAIVEGYLRGRGVGRCEGYAEMQSNMTRLLGIHHARIRGGKHRRIRPVR